jgi:hypothetical protein
MMGTDHKPGPEWVEPDMVRPLLDTWLSQLSGFDWQWWPLPRIIVERLARSFMVPPELLIGVRFPTLDLRKKSIFVTDLEVAIGLVCDASPTVRIPQPIVQGLAQYCVGFDPPGADGKVYWLPHVRALVEHLTASDAPVPQSKN